MSTAHTVLVVDDEAMLVEVLLRVLRTDGYRVLGAHSAREALEVLDREQVDVLVSDVDMPEMSGVELVARVRELHPDVVRILLTGGGSLGAAIRAINDGEIHRYLTKPCDKNELRATVRQAVERLAELRRSAAADRDAAARDHLLSELEREHPGICAVARVDGVYRLDAARLDAVARAIGLDVTPGHALADTWGPD